MEKKRKKKKTQWNFIIQKKNAKLVASLAKLKA
jgi:hypothetical protein